MYKGPGKQHNLQEGKGVVKLGRLRASHHLLGANVGGDGGEGEDAVVQARRVLQVLLQDVPKQLQQLVVVGLEGLRVGLHHLAQQQQAHLGRGQEGKRGRGLATATASLD